MRKQGWCRNIFIIHLYILIHTRPSTGDIDRSWYIDLWCDVFLSSSAFCSRIMNRKLGQKSKTWAKAIMTGPLVPSQENPPGPNRKRYPVRTVQNGPKFQLTIDNECTIQGGSSSQLRPLPAQCFLCEWIETSLLKRRSHGSRQQSSITTGRFWESCHTMLRIHKHHGTFIDKSLGASTVHKKWSLGDHLMVKILDILGRFGNHVSKDGNPMKSSHQEHSDHSTVLFVLRCIFGRPSFLVGRCWAPGYVQPPCWIEEALYELTRALNDYISRIFKWPVRPKHVDVDLQGRNIP